MSNFNLSDSLKKYNAVFTDKLLLLVVLLLGIAGLIFLLNLQKDPVLVTQQEKVLPKISPASNPPKTATQTNIEKPVTAPTKETKLTIKGDSEVGLPLNFSVSNLDPNIKYSIDFGNGIKRNLTGPNILYSYPQPGKYVVLIKATYQGQSKIVDSQTISIADEIEVVKKINE